MSFFVGVVISDPTNIIHQEEIDSIEEDSSELDEEAINYTVKESLGCTHYETNNDFHFWTPNCDQEIKPRVNQLFETINQAYTFYRDYGRKCGFDVRRNKGKKDTTSGKIKYKYIRCNHAGGNNNKIAINVAEHVENSGKRRRTTSRRCKCQAKITLKYMGDKGYVILSFVEDHNHPLVTEAGSKRGFGIYKELFGSYDNVGASATDFNNFGCDVKAQGRLTSFFFWADAIGRRNYDIFGDVLSFDPTFRTNRYNMVCVPFTGVDNHWNNVTFVAALLEKEDYTNFMWLIHVGFYTELFV
ncbi:hypothetical protein POM88_005973 [Heracleum sosnowskyi]|uniref:Protein FAR1-RELATED SEQUENCE n=1 Tax=Heracleum sosnowskyi TaxID=360622 RepID=A0AAD8J1Q3_9APIA|nr:hypothetical protein POM88_005973 [Heracleum sosnowskyi]